ncbi:MAG: penicillin acylase family protein [Pseudomonadota bacterium]
MKTWLKWIALGLLSLVLLALLGVWLYLHASLARLDGVQPAAGLSAPVTVARDAQGVPLISGANRADLAYATGFVHAQERYFQMDLLRRVGGGELAELFGARALPVDRSHRLHRFRARAEREVLAMAPADRQLLERYTAGINAGLAALGANPFEYALIGVKPRAWTAADSLLVVWAMYFDLQGNQEPRELARGWLREHASAEQLAFLLPDSSQWDAPFDAASVAAFNPAIPAAPPPWWGQPRAGKPATLAMADFIDSVGSNNWAVAGSRSADGGAIVSDDMHLGISLPNTWYRLALQMPDPRGGTRRLVGVTLPGAAPLIIAGSNGHVAWGYTNSYGDYLDLVELGADTAHPGQVRTPRGWETPQSSVETIQVKGAPAERLVVRESTFGPLRETGGKLYAIHWVAHAPGALNLNPQKLEDANSVDEALAAAATIGIPAQNIVAGDDKGNIGWTIAGLLPRRAQAGTATTFPLALDGAVPSWEGNLAPREYPRIVNPPTGQLSTANNRQLLGAGAQLIGDGGFDIGARNQQARDDLLALGARTSVKSVYGVMLDDRALFMTVWRERALKALDAQALEQHAARAEFQRLLSTSWSGRASVDSVGYRLTRNFMWALYEQLYDGVNGTLAQLDEKATVAAASSRWPVVLGRLIDAQASAWLPPGHTDWRSVQLAAIDKVIADLAKEGKPMAAASWGERNAAAIGHPIGNAMPFLKYWLAAPADQLPGDGNMPRVAGRNFGQSERLTVTPGKEEQGVFNMPGGQSGHPLSPFFLLGHADWVAGKPTPLLPGAAKYTLTLK